MVLGLDLTSSGGEVIDDRLRPPNITLYRALAMAALKEVKERAEHASPTLAAALCFTRSSGDRFTRDAPRE